MMRSSVVAVLVAALVAGMPAGEAVAAKRKKSTMSARIGGKPFKASGRLVFGHNGGLILLLTGTRRKGRTTRTLAFGCVPTDLATATFPLVCEGNGNYQEVSLRKPPLAKVWGTVHGMRVTIDSFDGVRARGSFGGTFEFGNQNGLQPLGPIAVEGGKFDLVIRR